MIGAEPGARRLRDLVKLNDGGFILTGRDVPRAHGRSPSTLPFETSLPGDQDAGCPDPGICAPRAGSDKAIACKWGR
jgi:hypothetical protein